MARRITKRVLRRRRIATAAERQRAQRKAIMALLPPNCRKPLKGSAVIYDGPSLLDGEPILVIAVRTKEKSANRKTGAVLQTYIVRKFINPLEANKTGADFSICGNCPMRGIPTDDPAAKQAKERPCYVVLGQGPLNVWRSFWNGRYATVRGHEAIAAIGAGQDVRIGTYGDGAAVPGYVWDSLLSRARKHMAYSHQSKFAGAGFRGDIMMVSADTQIEAEAAWLQGFRTFRVLRQGEAPVQGKEINCPSLIGVHCNACGLCGGANVKAKNIVIPAHVAHALRRTTMRCARMRIACQLRSATNCA